MTEDAARIKAFEAEIFCRDNLLREKNPFDRSDMSLNKKETNNIFVTPEPEELQERRRRKSKKKADESDEDERSHSSRRSKSKTESSKKKSRRKDA